MDRRKLLLMSGRPRWLSKFSSFATNYLVNQYYLSQLKQALTTVDADTRASKANLSDGTTWREFANNEIARIDRVGLFVGAGKSNLFTTNGEGQSGLNIPTNCTRSAGTAVGPVNGTAFFATYTSTAASGGYQRNFTIAADTAWWVASAHIAKTAASQQSYLSLGGIGGTSITASVVIDSQTGEIVSGASIGSVVDMGTSWQVYIGFKNQSNTTLFVVFRPVQGGTGVGQAGGFNLYTGRDILPYIGTTASPRSSDNMQTSLGSWWTLNGGFEFFVTINSTFFTEIVERTIAEFHDGTANNIARLYLSALGVPSLSIYSGGVLQASLSLTTPIGRDRRVLSARIVANDFRLSCNITGEIATGTGSLPSGLTTFQHGASQDVSALLSGLIEQEQITSPLSDSDRAALVSVQQPYVAPHPDIPQFGSYMGPWKSGTSHIAGDIVLFSGGYYLCCKTHITASDPVTDTTRWEVIPVSTGATLFDDAFNYSDGALNGRTTTEGYTWASGGVGAANAVVGSGYVTSSGNTYCSVAGIGQVEDWIVWNYDNFASPQFTLALGNNVATLAEMLHFDFGAIGMQPLWWSGGSSAQPFSSAKLATYVNTYAFVQAQTYKVAIKRRGKCAFAFIDDILVYVLVDNLIGSMDLNSAFFQIQTGGSLGDQRAYRAIMSGIA